MKKNLIAGILVLATFVFAGCGTATTATPNAPDNSGEANALRFDGQSQEAVADETTPGGAMMKMQPQEPSPLTEEQSKQLEAANADHEPATLTFNVDGGNFYFTPNEIRVKKGDTVKIVFNNTGGMHNFVLDEFNVTMDPIKESGSQTVEFVADKVGSFEYYCSVGSHRQMGMKGTVIVEE